MAYGHVTADPAAFATALANLRTLQVAGLPQSRGTEFPGSPDGTDILAAAEEAVLDLHAPTFSAVIEKLTILWQPEMWDDSEEARHRLMVIGDLRRLSFYLP